MPQPPENPADISRFGCSRDKRGDCVQIVIAHIVTPEGFPIAYEVLAGNTADKAIGTGFDRLGTHTALIVDAQDNQPGLRAGCPELLQPAEIRGPREGDVGDNG